MNILFIYSFQDYQVQGKEMQGQLMHVGISYISSLLKSHGHQTELLVLNQYSKKQEIKQVLIQFQPALICFTAVVTEYQLVLRIARFIKSAFPSIYLLIGGIHATLSPKLAFQDPFDAVCIGEGEYPTLELVEQLEKDKIPHNIKNLWLRTENGVEKNPPREFIQNLDNLPFPDREMWHKWISPDSPQKVILLARGCPFSCTYCSNHALKKVATGKYVRFRSVRNVLQEMEELVTKFPKTKEIRFVVETIGVDMEFALNLCSELEKFNKKRQRPLAFELNLRITPNKDFEPLFRALKKANFRSVNFGLESGSERIRKEILNRNYSNTDIINAIRLAKKHGLRTLTYNLIGLPGETLADFKETLACNRKSLPDGAKLHIFFPYPGTKLYDLCKEKGLLDHKLDGKLERRRAVLN
ncbi:MAG: B12-binding domain-containing radical SAM protein, partial [Candidatus Heimdallarchaeota archaeon]